MPVGAANVLELLGALLAGAALVWWINHTDMKKAKQSQPAPTPAVTIEDVPGGHLATCTAPRCRNWFVVNTDRDVVSEKAWNHLDEEHRHG